MEPIMSPGSVAFFWGRLSGEVPACFLSMSALTLPLLGDWESPHAHP